MNRALWILAALLSLLILGGCAQGGPHRNYPAGSMGTAMQVQHGEVLTIEPVSVDGYHSVVGTWGGAAIGNSIGRTVGGGSGRRIAGSLGAVAGAVTGRSVERASTARAAVEVIVQLDNGQVIAIVQPNSETLHPGDRVRVLRGRRSNQIVPI